TDVSSQGTISLKIVAGVSGDTNIQNNEMTFSVTKTALTGPDLKLELGAIGKATVNTAYEIPVTIRNIGGTSTSKSISVQYDLYDAATGAYKPHGQTVTINNPIAPGATANVNLRFPAKSVAGKYSLWAILTSAEDVNGANNDALFDLDVVSSGIDVKAEFGAIEIPVVGTRKIIPVTLKNIGTVDASKGVKMTFYVLSPAGLHESKYTTSINSLDVQESVVVNVPYTPSSADITNSKVTIKVEAE
ncbi:hypothetical protein J4401_04630, partial [Candidatus Woesearchaeota archaeon]|nr:hypothetical protein [Candidatus Woesearchaeota archaeon]